MFRHKGTAVITGVASGTSLIYARRMAALGYDLILVGCDRERLHTTARRITDVCGRCVEVLAGDLAVSEDLQRIEQMLRDDASITLLVAYAARPPRSGCAIDRLSDALMPGFAARRCGAVIQVTGKARCPLDEAWWTLSLLQWDQGQASAH